MAKERLSEPKDQEERLDDARWWQAYCATIAGRQTGLSGEDFDSLAKTYADFADALYHEAFERGRL